MLFGFRFRQMRRYLAFQPEEIPRVYRLLQAAADGSSGHGPTHLLLESAVEIGFFWCSRFLGWDRPGLPVLGMIDGLFSIFVLLFWMFGVTRFLWVCVLGRVFGVACSSLTLTMFGKEIRHCFEAFLFGVSGMVFCWEKSGTIINVSNDFREMKSNAPMPSMDNTVVRQSMFWEWHKTFRSHTCRLLMKCNSCFRHITQVERLFGTPISGKCHPQQCPSPFRWRAVILPNLITSTILEASLLVIALPT